MSEVDLPLNESAVVPEAAPAAAPAPKEERLPLQVDDRRFQRLPLWLKIASTAFVYILVREVSKNYGPIKIMWFSEMGLFGTVAAMWLESPLLASMMLLMVFIPDGIAWTGDLACGWLTGYYPLDITDYMFDEEIPLFCRTLSLFHTVVPIVLVWMIYKLGYDRRALFWQTILGTALLWITYLFTTPDDNINRVFGPYDPQTRVHPWVYLVWLMAFCPIVLYLPVHLALYWTPWALHRRKHMQGGR
jgi:hypothetical protein